MKTKKLIIVIILLFLCVAVFILSPRVRTTIAGGLQKSIAKVKQTVQIKLDDHMANRMEREYLKAKDKDVWQPNAEEEQALQKRQDIYEREQKRTAQTDYMQNHISRLSEYIGMDDDTMATTYYKKLEAWGETVSAFLNNKADIKSAVSIDKRFNFEDVLPKDIKFLFLGELHFGNAYMPVGKAVRDLNKAGRLDAYASEFLIENMNTEITRFIRTGNADYVRCFKKDSFQLDAINQYTLQAAKGVKTVVALEDPREQYILRLDFIPNYHLFGSDRADTPYDVAARNILWTKKLAPLASRDGVTAVYGGAAHFLRGDNSGSVPERLRAVRPSANMANILFVPENSNYIKVPLAWQNANYFITVPQDKRAGIGYDYIVLYNQEAQNP